MKIAGIVNDSVVDGTGWRLTVFTQGCPHHCKSCHNPETWDYNGGTEMSVTEILEKYKSNSLLDGITLSGGEPFIPERHAELLELVKEIKKLGGDIWAYSGYVLEELLQSYSDILEHIDYVVDGLFMEDQKSLNISFRGSTNQRIMKNMGDKWIDVSSDFDQWVSQTTPKPLN